MSIKGVKKVYKGIGGMGGLPKNFINFATLIAQDRSGTVRSGLTLMITQ
jgi:hypothetical protein